ncbi:MAG: glycosyltransferase family 1 protein [Elusimicrobiota bacterium]
MRIGINARYIQKQATGIENYLSQIISNLKRIDSKNEYVLFFGSDKPVPGGFPSDNFAVDVPKFKTNSQLKRLFWEHFYLPSAITRNKIDVFHEPSFIAPMFKKCPTVITIHDLAFIIHPECFTFKNVLYFKAMMKRSIESSDYVIAVSESTKNDIINRFKVSPEKVKMIHSGVNEYFHRIEDKKAIKPVLEKYGITRDFILNVSLISPRKNLLNLLKSFKLMREKKSVDYQLVITGAKGWLYEDIFKAVSDLSLQKDVVFTGYVSDSELLCLYNSAKIFAYPSVYEGFGFPALEAMACGCPVVASNTSSLPEICGDAALLVEPADLDELSDALYRMLTDSKLREDMIKRGFVRITKFSWRNTAKETLSLYHTLYAKN